MLTEKQKITVLKAALKLAADKLYLSDDYEYYTSTSEEIYLMLLNEAKNKLNFNKWYAYFQSLV